MAEIADKQIKRLNKLLEAAETNLAGAKELLASLVDNGLLTDGAPAVSVPTGKVIEGVFDGQNMIGPDNKTYPVPANYASKSKLVQGDVLKLTIADDGSFIYKQIGPVERRKLIGTLVLNDGQFFAQTKDAQYKVLYASVTYFKADQGQQVTIVVPEDGPSDWAAIEAAIT